MANDFRGRNDLPRGFRDNNPGNIRPGDSWQGMVGSENDYIIFKDTSWGLRAMATDISSKIGKGFNTITKIVNRYAPPGPPDYNPAANYIAEVSRISGFGPNDTLTADADTIRRLMKGHISFENGKDYAYLVTDSDIDDAFSMMSHPLASFIQAAVITAESNPGTVVAAVAFLLAAVGGYFYMRKNKH